MGLNASTTERTGTPVLAARAGWRSIDPRRAELEEYLAVGCQLAGADAARIEGRGDLDGLEFAAIGDASGPVGGNHELTHELRLPVPDHLGALAAEMCFVGAGIPSDSDLEILRELAHLAGEIVCGRRPERTEMGTIIDFPADAASQRLDHRMDGAPRDGMGTILILPVIRIDRDQTDQTGGGSGPEEGAAPRRRRRRRT